MEALIGRGAHAGDIAATKKFDLVCPHHDYWLGYTAVRPFHGLITIGINDPQLRAQIATKLGIDDCKWVHPHAYIDDCEIRPGTHVNYGVTMTRTTIGAHCTISPGVTICGDVKIGDRVLVGAGATICDRVTIHDDTIIGAGAVVLPESILDGGTWVGNPARRIK